MKSPALARDYPGELAVQQQRATHDPGGRNVMQILHPTWKLVGFISDRLVDGVLKFPKFYITWIKTGHPNSSFFSINFIHPTVSRHPTKKPIKPSNSCTPQKKSASTPFFLEASYSVPLYRSNRSLKATARYAPVAGYSNDDAILQFPHLGWWDSHGIRSPKPNRCLEKVNQTLFFPNWWCFDGDASCEISIRKKKHKQITKTQKL